MRSPICTSVDSSVGYFNQVVYPEHPGLTFAFVLPPRQITVTDQGVPARSTTVRVIVQVLDENDNRPIFMEKVYKIKLPEREKVEKERSTRREPVYRVIASDRDHSANAEISYSIEDGDEQGKFFIEPKTGLVSSKKFSSAGEYDILTVRPADGLVQVFQYHISYFCTTWDGAI